MRRLSLVILLFFSILTASAQTKPLMRPIPNYGFANFERNHIQYPGDSLSMERFFQKMDSVEFLDATHEISKAYQNCDVFCLPSLFEGYPNVVCEAMSCGKPIVASRVSDVPYIVEEGVNGFLFDPLNEDDIYNKLLKICSMSREQLEQMGRNNREYAIENFSKESFINKYRKIIDE